jgi:hypothetical protein
MHFSDLFVNNTSKRLNEIASERFSLIKKLMINALIDIKTIQTEVCLYEVIEKRIADIHQEIDDIISCPWHPFISLHLFKIGSKKEL